MPETTFSSHAPPERRLFCNRTLNLRSIAAVGFDMDYTLVHYLPEKWELRAYEHVRRRLLADGYPVKHLEFDPEAFTLGLVIDRELGNVVKANRFGFVKTASHGMRMLSFEEMRQVYSRVVVDLAEPRWEFMNTLFSLSEACLWAQLVDLADADKLPGVHGYRDLHNLVKHRLDATHMEGKLKQEIADRPDDFVVLDEELPLALMDLKEAGKKLVLVTNSEWEYTRVMMSYAFDRFFPKGFTWRDAFDIVIVAARKPDFFSTRSPAFEVVDEAGLLRPLVGGLKLGGTYLGGNAGLVEHALGCPGEEILYVGDHIFSDVHVTKNILRWRTCLIARVLEEEVAALTRFQEEQVELDTLMAEKERIEAEQATLRIRLQRLERGYGPQPKLGAGAMKRRLAARRGRGEALDGRIAVLAERAGRLVNDRWGPLMRAGNDKSHLARQVERYADIYTSRVSNFLYQTPFVYLRSHRGSLPHDPVASIASAARLSVARKS